MGIIVLRTMPSSDPETSSESAIALERDLYRRLLELGEEDDLKPFLQEALSLVVKITGAAQGYLELRHEGAHQADWCLAHGFSEGELEMLRATISSGIVAEALATGRTVETASALLDRRFQDRQSVRTGRIEAVLCAPIGGDAARGVLYLAGAAGAGPFSAEDTRRAELFTRHLAPFADRLLARARSRAAADPTLPIRERLRADRMVGHSAALASVLEQAALVAPLDVTVLITGASGTGKSALARLIHENGPRATGPFIDLNCGALPEGLVESELFGALPGAHATARSQMVGKVEAAEGGTLLLDEIGELPHAAQAKLLQLLQAHEYFPLGAAEARSADIRLIAATNIDLDRAVEEKLFREDLYYRLQVVPIRMPSLQERTEDLADLARALVVEASQRHGLPRLTLSPGTLHAIAASEWPGNVRQLSHALEAAAIRAAGQGLVRIEAPHVFPGAPSPGARGGEAATFQEATREFQRSLLLRTLKETGWNVTEAARRLDLARSHVYNLIKSFDLERA